MCQSSQRAAILPKIAAINQNIAIRRKRTADRRKRTCQTAVNRVRINPGRAKEKCARFAVADNMDRADIALTRQREAHLVDAVLAAIDQDNRAFARPFLRKHFITRNVGIDKNNRVVGRFDRNRAAALHARVFGQLHVDAALVAKNLRARIAGLERCGQACIIITERDDFGRRRISLLDRQLVGRQRLIVHCFSNIARRRNRGCVKHHAGFKSEKVARSA